MPARTILELGNPLLWQTSDAVVDVKAEKSTILDLADTLTAFRDQYGFGRGIAAPQIGINKRIIFIHVPNRLSGPLINPRIEWSSTEQMQLWDDCFSLPGLMVHVNRAQRVRVSYTDENSQACSVEADGDLSELLQHEIDHLDGILAIQRAISPHALCTRAEWQRRYT